MNILKTIFSITFGIEAVFVINRFVSNYSNDGVMFISLALLLFLLHLFAWVAPKKLFDLCWKASSIYPDDFDYDTSYKKLGLIGMWLLIVSIVILMMSLLVI